VSQTSIKQITKPDFMITSDHSNGKDEQTNFWFKPRFLNKSTNSSSTVVLNFVPGQPSETITEIADPKSFTTAHPLLQTKLFKLVLLPELQKFLLHPPCF